MVAKESGAEIFNNKIRQGYSKSLEKGILKQKVWASHMLYHLMLMENFHHYILKNF